MTKALFDYLINKGLDCNLYSVLLLIKNNEELQKDNIKIQSWILLLKKHKLLSEQETLTELAISLFSEIDNLHQKDSFNITTWSEQLHKKVSDKLLALTGKNQVRPQIKGKSYSFLCNTKDFEKKIKNFLKIYKVKDYQKVENVILQYVDSCHKENSWMPLLEYYILKDGNSRLATDLESTVEEQIPETKKPVDVKTLF